MVILSASFLSCDEFLFNAQEARISIARSFGKVKPFLQNTGLSAIMIPFAFLSTDGFPPLFRNIRPCGPSEPPETNTVCLPAPCGAERKGANRKPTVSYTHLYAALRNRFSNCFEILLLSYRILERNTRRKRTTVAHCGGMWYNKEQTKRRRALPGKPPKTALPRPEGRNPK